MKTLKKQFIEFKSIFFSDNLLKENEQHANIVTASTMMNLFWICIITWLLVYFDVFKVGIKIISMILISSIVLLLIPAIICYIIKGKGNWIKHLLFISFTILLAIADALLKYNVTLIMVIPTILAARYYNKKFTLSVAIFTTILFIGSAFVSTKIGQQDLNSYNLIIPSGTTITVDNTLRDAVSLVEVDENQRLINIFIHFFLPKILVFNIIAFACVQISQSGKKMIEKQKEISKDTERIETELNLANAIQKNMLPSIFPPFPEHREIDIYADMTPAKEVGGDFYDMFLIDDNHLAICMADVSGKGVPASLVMMISKILIKNVSKIDKDVSKTLTRVNSMLCDGNNSSIFVTSWFGIINLQTGDMEFSNAGHNPPLLFTKKTGKFTYLKQNPNLVLAAMENTEYDTNKIHMEPGDRIFLYTDGVVESINNNNEQYGEERLNKFLNDNINLDATETIKELKNDLNNFVGEVEQFDDITMLELIYKNNGELIKEFKANKTELQNVHDFVKKEVEQLNFDEKTTKQIYLTVEEVFINIASYAYKDEEGKCLIKIKSNSDKLEIIFEDSGIPFNPLEKKDPDVTLTHKERKIGGLGIFMIKKMMDNIDYKYENNKNILKITKNIK